MNKTVYRHLLEQRWREEGALDLLVSGLIIFLCSTNLLIADGAYSSDECCT